MSDDDDDWTDRQLDKITEARRLLDEAERALREDRSGVRGMTPEQRRAWIRQRNRRIKVIAAIAGSGAATWRVIKAHPAQAIAIGLSSGALGTAALITILSGPDSQPMAQPPAPTVTTSPAQPTQTPTIPMVPTTTTPMTMDPPTMAPPMMTSSPVEPVEPEPTRTEPTTEPTQTPGPPATNQPTTTPTSTPPTEPHHPPPARGGQPTSPPCLVDLHVAGNEIRICL